MAVADFYSLLKSALVILNNCDESSCQDNEKRESKNVYPIMASFSSSQFIRNGKCDRYDSAT